MSRRARARRFRQRLKRALVAGFLGGVVVGFVTAPR